MLKPFHIETDQLTAEAMATRHARAAMAMELAKSTFQALHGIYGNLLFSRYQTGQLDGSGADEGLLGAMRQWAYELRRFDEETVKAAINRAKQVHTDFPPSLPQFAEICRAVQPRQVSADSHPKNGPLPLPMSGRLRSAYARTSREIVARHNAKALAQRLGGVQLEPGLAGLKEAIARAVGDAGGDEAAELLRLDHLLTPEKSQHVGAAQ